MLRSVLLAALLALVAAAPAGAIVGGSAAAPDRWPWMAALLEGNGANAAEAQYCGGVVIAARRVLTAGHCVLGQRTDALEALIGRTRLSAAGGRRIRVRAISVFPGFVDGRTPSLDTAVVTLAADAGVAPVALARPGQDAAWAPGTPAWTLGWGRLNARRSRGGHYYYADRLRELQVPVQGDDACEGAYGTGFQDFPYRAEWLVCAGRGDGHTGACAGDSGAPLVVGSPGAWLDVGVLDGGDDCASPGYFDLYARADAISGFALGARLTVQPEPVGGPRIAGRLAAGAVVRCRPGRWRGSPARLEIRWLRAGDRSGRVLGRGTAHRLSARDARAGVTCAVTAANRGGRLTATAALRPA